jgi:hypothetical protein
MDLAKLFETAAEWHKKSQDIAKRREKIEQEFDREYNEGVKTLNEDTRKLLEEIQTALVKYFTDTGRVVRKQDVSGGLVEVFIGPQAKVSAHIAISQAAHIPYTNWKLRNDAVEDMDGQLAPKNTVKKLIDVVKKADKKGFWDLPSKKANVRVAFERALKMRAAL